MVRIGTVIFAAASVLLVSQPALARYVYAHVDQSVANPPIDYPYSLRFRGAQGTAILRVHVSYAGRPDKVEIVQSTGDKDLDNVAAEGVLNWHYVPANDDGENVSDWAVVKIDFKVDRSAGPPAVR